MGCEKCGGEGAYYASYSDQMDDRLTDCKCTRPSRAEYNKLAKENHNLKAENLKLRENLAEAKEYIGKTVDGCKTYTAALNQIDSMLLSRKQQLADILAVGGPVPPFTLDCDAEGVVERVRAKLIKFEYRGKRKRCPKQAKR